MKLYFYTLFFTLAFNSFSVSQIQKTPILLEWKRFSKIIVSKKWTKTVETVIKDVRPGYYKISSDSDGKIKYEIVNNKSESCFEFDKNISFIKIYSVAYFAEFSKIIYIKYKVMNEINSKIKFSGKIKSVKKIEIISKRQVSAWYHMCQK